jgi:hypothetical protein
MILDTGNRFQSFTLTEEEDKAARTVNPYTLALIQNKVSHYANEVLNRKWEQDKDSPNADKIAVLEVERLRAQVEVLEELLYELQTPEASEDVEGNPTQKDDPRPPAPFMI